MSLEDQIAQMVNPQDFTRLCNLLFTEMYGRDFQIVDGTRSDEGNDGYITSEKRMLAIHCPIKPERKTDAGYLAKIRGDLLKAEKLRDEGMMEIVEWTFITPRKLSQSVLKNLLKLSQECGIRANHQESTYLASILQKNRHLVNECPFLEISEIDKKLDKILELLERKDIAEEQIEQELDDNHFLYRDSSEPEILQQLVELRSQAETSSTKSEIRTIYYKATDPITKINAIIGLLDSFMPADDDIADLLSLCEEGVMLADQLESKSAKAYIVAMKGNLLSFQFSELDLRTAYQIMSGNIVGFQLITEEQRTEIVAKLNYLDMEFNSAFNAAISLALENRDYDMLATVLIIIGNSAGQRTIYLEKLNPNGRAVIDKAICKRSIIAAKDIRSSLGDECGANNALFNLANQIRFFDEEEEALRLAHDTLRVAERCGDQLLIQRANMLIETLESGHIPDYLAGERRF